MHLKERLNLSTNYLKRNPDSEMGWTPYFESFLTNDRYPYYKHAPWDLCDVGWRFVEAWHMVRRVTGEPVSKEEEHLRTAVFSSIKEDGLSYRRKEAWSTAEAWMWDQGRALLTLCSLAEGNDKETDRAVSLTGNMLHALEKIALRDGEALWFPAEGWDGEKWVSPPVGHPPTGLQIEGAVRYYKLTNESWALDFAEKVARGVITRTPPLLTSEGRFQRNGGGPNIPNTHLHSRLFILGGLYRLADVSGNQTYRDLAKKGLQAVLKISTSYGWVPERIEQLDWGIYAIDEVCCIMDVIKFIFADTVITPQNYDMVERFTANGIASHQIVNYEKVKPYLSSDNQPSNTEQYNYDNVLERCLGGFTGALHAHEFWRSISNDEGMLPYPLIEASGCCSPAGITSFCLVWEKTLEETDDMAVMHMHFPREGKKIDIEKATLREGDVCIRVKKSIAKLKVRIHPWAVQDKIRVQVAGKPASPRMDGSYLIIDNPRDKVEIKYPTISRKTVEPWRGGNLVAFWEGNVVKNIVSDFPQRIPLFPL